MSEIPPTSQETSPQGEDEAHFEVHLTEEVQRAVENEIANEVEEQIEVELAFPCEYPVKIMGKNENDFLGFAVDLVCRHVPGLTHEMFTSHQSSGGKYLSVSVKFIAESRVQVDGLYEEMRQHKRILFAL